VILHWRTGRWTQSPPGPLTADAQYRFVPDRAGGVWDGSLADWTGQSWVTAAVGTCLQSYAGYQIDGLARIPGSTQLWGAGAAPVSGDTSSAMIASYN